jgi:hypothetical protein
MRTNAVARPWRTSPVSSAVLAAVGSSIVVFIAWVWLVPEDDPARRVKALVAAVALAAFVGGMGCLRRARAARRWRAALNRYSEQEEAKRTPSRKGPHARPQSKVPSPDSRQRPDQVRFYQGATTYERQPSHHP